MNSGGTIGFEYTVHFQGENFVQLLERQSLEAFLGQVAATHPGCTLSLCLEGLQSYLRQIPYHAM